jgi:hypothetical protein
VNQTTYIQTILLLKTEAKQWSQHITTGSRLAMFLFGYSEWNGIRARSEYNIKKKFNTEMGTYYDQVRRSFLNGADQYVETVWNYSWDE